MAMVLDSSRGREFISEFRAGGSWFDKVNVGALGDDVRRAILDRVRQKLCSVEAAKALGIAKSSLYRYLSGECRVPNDVVRVLCAT